MKSTIKKIAPWMFVCLFVAIFVAGCSSEPAGTPIGKRAPGQDISAQDRADKRGKD